MPRATNPTIRRCNRTAKCSRCTCARSRKPCTGCLPAVHDRCQNRGPLSTTTPLASLVSPASPQHSLTVPTQDQSPQALVANPPVVTAGPPSPIAVSPLPPLTAILQSHIPTLQHVPKGARDCWSKALSDCLLSVSDNPGDLTHWSKLFMLPKCVLASPAAGHRLPWREILQQVRSRLRRWAAGDLLPLWEEATANGHTLSQRLSSSVTSTTSQRCHNARRARRAVQDGLYSKAIKSLTSVGIASPSPEVLREMQEKYPQAPPPSLPSGPVPRPLSLSESSVLNAIKSFPNGSAPGPSGLRPNHLREVVQCPSSDRAVQVLTSLTRFCKYPCLGQGSIFCSIPPL